MIAKDEKQWSTTNISVVLQPVFPRIKIRQLGNIVMQYFKFNTLRHNHLATQTNVTNARGLQIII